MKNSKRFLAVLMALSICIGLMTGLAVTVGANDWEAPEIDVFDPVIVTGYNRGSSLILDGAITIKTYVAFKNAEDLTPAYIVENGGMLYWSESDLPEDAVYGTETYAKALANAGVYEGIQEYTASSEGIAAKEYGDTWYFRTYVVIDGEYHYGDLLTYSVQTYANNQIKQGRPTKNLLAAMLNYGTAAQNHFTYKTDAPVNAILAQYVENGTLDASVMELNWSDDYLPTLNGVSDTMGANFVKSEGMTDNGKTLSLVGAIQANFYMGIFDHDFMAQVATQTAYFWTEDAYAAIEAEGGSLTTDNASYSVTIDEVPTYTGAKYGYEYKVISEGIAAKNLGKKLYVSLVVTGEDGTTYCSGVTEYGANVYAKAQLDKDTATEELKTLMKWMMVYSNIADAYYNG